MTAPAGGRRPLLLRYGLAALVVIGLVLVIGPRGQSGPPLDPRSTAPLGTRGIVEVMQRLGADVRVGAGAPATGQDGVALVISDDLSEAQHADLQEWVTAGGRLVVADPLSELAPDLVGLTSVAFTEPTIEPGCQDPLVAGVGRVAVSGGNVFDLPAGATGCFPRNDGWWMIRSPEGEGEIITLGGPLTLTNELLDIEDTAVLLVNLLTPPEGAGLHVVTADDPLAAPDSLGELLPDQVGLALLQIPLAWAALVWWRARRHGRPVVEPVDVRIEAAETTVAVGNLLHRAGRATDAAAIIRARLHAELSRRLGIHEVDDPQQFCDIAAARTDLEPHLLRSLLLDPPPRTDEELVRYANRAATALAGIRQRRRADPNEGSTAAVAVTAGAPTTDQHPGSSPAGHDRSTNP